MPKMPENIDIAKIKKEYLGLFCIILICFIVFFAYTNVFSPILAKLKAVSTQLEQRKNSIQKTAAAFQSLDEFKKEIDRTQFQLDSYQQKLRVLTDVPRILKELNKLAKRPKVRIVSVNPLEAERISLPASQDFFIERAIRIKLICGYHRLGEFINEIENSDNFIKVIGLEISAGSQDIWNHDAELIIASYSLVSKGTKK